VLAQLPTERLQVHAVLNAGQVEEHLVNRILFHPWGQLLQAAHHAR
jgi:hypothetical protein